ncbi:MAG: hypothetical protein KAR76_06880 [Methanosarcinales archaeon]|nr:hypothetical protein [Methanosarcinales archaeon]
MLENLIENCKILGDDHDVVKNKASSYEYLIKRLFELYFNKTDDYVLDLFPIIEIGESRKYLTPDMKLSTSNNDKKIIIIIEIKHFEDSSRNKIVARRKARNQMDEYIGAYEVNNPDALVVPLFITQNPYLNQYPNEYPCIVLPLDELYNGVELKSIIHEKLNDYARS